jgi:phosphomannomutase
MGELLKLQNGSDIRGIAVYGVKGENVNLTMIEARKVAAAFGQWLKEKTGKTEVTVAVGRDPRISGDELMEGAIEGLNFSGAKVYDFGIATTPAMFMCTVDNELKCDGSIMITASHLPYNRNGMKFFTKDGSTGKSDILEILNRAEEIETENYDIKSQKKDFLSRYAEKLVRLIREKTGEDTPFAGTRIIVDAGNGSGGFFVSKVLWPLGADTTGSLYLEKNGMFPNHVPNPELPAVMENFSRHVVAEKADLGILFDTDVDRAAIVDGNGAEINRNRIVALMSAIVLEETPGTTIVTDSVTSSGLKGFIEAHGGKHHRFKRGYKNVIDESRRLNSEGVSSALAMETSGHCALQENYFMDDGAYMIVKILIKFAELKKQGKSISDMIAGLKEPAESEEMRVKIQTEDFKAYGQQVLKDFDAYVAECPGASMEKPNFEGVRVNFDKNHGNGWCLLRMSLHDPVMPVNVESDEAGGLAMIKDSLFKFLNSYDGLKF